MPPTDGKPVHFEGAAHGQSNTILMHGPVSKEEGSRRGGDGSPSIYQDRSALWIQLEINVLFFLLCLISVSPDQCTGFTGNGPFNTSRGLISLNNPGNAAPNQTAFGKRKIHTIFIRT